MTDMNNKDNYSAEALKERGHAVIEESKWENFDKMVDNNCKSYIGLRYVDNVLIHCEIMHNEAMPLAEEIPDFKYDPNGSLSERMKYLEFMLPIWERERKIHEDLKSHMFIRDYKILTIAPNGKEKVRDVVPIYSTRSGMFLIEYPYKYRLEDCLKITRHIGKVFGMCYGIFNNVPMFSFDTYDTFFRRQHNGLTQEDYVEFREAVRDDLCTDGEKAERILRERTWKHLEKRY